MNNIILTGSSGLIGSNLLNFFEINKYNILNISNNADSKKGIYCDFENKYHLDNLINNNFKPDVLIHAGWGAMDDPNSDFHIKDNFNTSKKLFDNLISFDLKKIIFIGSIEEYGSRNGELYEDMEPLGVLRNYEKGKIKVAKYGFDVAEKNNIDFIHIRLANTFGFPQKENSLIYNLHDCIKNNNIPKFGPCINGRDYLYVNEVVKGIDSLLKINQSITVNLGAGKTIIQKDFAKTYWELLGGDPNDIIFEESKNEDEKREVYMNINRIKNICGWSPHLTLKESVKMMIGNN